MDKGLPYRVMKVCLNHVVVMLHNLVNILKTTEMYTLKWWLLWHLKHISINKDDLSEKSVCLWNRNGGGKWVLVLTLRPHSLHKKVDGSPGVQHTWSQRQWALTTKGELPQAEKGETCATNCMCPNQWDTMGSPTVMNEGGRFLTNVPCEVPALRGLQEAV